MINSSLPFIGQRHQARNLSCALLVVAGLLVWPLPLLKAGGVASGGPRLVAQARAGAEVVPSEVEAWIRQVQMLYQQGKFNEAIRLQEQILAWTEKTYGPNHSETVISLNNLAFLHGRQGVYAKAEFLYLRALAIREKALGPDHNDTSHSLYNLAYLYVNEGAYDKVERLFFHGLAAKRMSGQTHQADGIERLNNLALLYMNEGSYANAQLLFFRALAITEKSLGPDHPHAAFSLNGLAGLYERQGAYAKAEPLYLRGLAITEKALGPDHPSTSGILNNLGLMYVKKGAYGKAEPLLLRGLAIREKAQGFDHPDTAQSLNSLAMLLHKQGEYAKAEQHYRRALAIIESALGTDHPNTAFILNNFAALYESQGAYAKAEPLYLRSLAIREKALGSDHHDIAQSLNNLAGLYRSQGAYATAEPLYLRALAIREKVLGPDHPDTATSLNNLAGLYGSQGAYAKAEPLYLRALAIREKALGPDHPDTAQSRNNLAFLYGSQGVYSKAEPLSLRALAIREKALGTDHPDTATTLNNLAYLYGRQVAYAKAEPLFLRALAIKEKALGTDHPDTADSLNNLAMLYYSQGAYTKAEPLYLRSLAISEKALGPDHLTTALSLNNLALLYDSLGANAKAEPLLRRGIGIQSLFLQGQLPLLPQAARQAQVQALDASWEIAFSGAERSASAAELALFSRLNRYGLLLEIEQRQAQLARAPGAPQNLANQIAALTTKLADAATPATQRQELGKRREELEREFYRLLPSLKPQLVEPAQVARLLPASAVLVEFQRYQPFDARQKTGQRWGAPRYLALVLTPAGTTGAVDLGPAKAIDDLIAGALEESKASGGDPTALWRQVNEKVFPPPLLQLLAGVKQWILAPDGELSRIPYAALPAPQDRQRRLTDTVSLRLVSSGRSLLPQSPANVGAPSRPLVLADPDFGPAPASGSRWSRLPGTAKEGQVISQLLRADLYEQARATTAALTNAKNPALVHVASHGYYASASNTPPATAPPPLAGGLRSAIEGLPASREDAMLNSFIVLAGANRSLRPDRALATSPSSSQNSADDGYLTAKEAAQLQLKGTELVVLSACDTASGQQQSGEGLFGLQRALSVAGARTTLLSLWKVDDDATAFFMERYYTLLKQGKGRMEALLAVQEEFRTKPLLKNAWADYRYWAAFQLVGETGPIGGL
jgi:CHAT domain-containing protein/Tfp pilus assembly protein PilF